MLVPIYEHGILMALCGRLSPQIRMYSLPLLAQIATGQRRLEGKVPNIKLNGTRSCRHFSVARAQGTTFLCAAVRKQVLLFMWAGFPHNKFMRVKEWELPEICSAVEPIFGDDGAISQIAVQCVTRFVMINVDSPTSALLQFDKKSQPTGLFTVDHKQVFLVFNKQGFFLDTLRMQPAGPIFQWRTSPSVVGTPSAMVT